LLNAVVDGGGGGGRLTELGGGGGRLTALGDGGGGGKPTLLDNAANAS
jgi:hypothetical protein